MNAYAVTSVLAGLLATCGLVLALVGIFYESKQSAVEWSKRPSLEFVGAYALLGLSNVASLFSQPLAELSLWRAGTYALVAIVFLGIAASAVAKRRRHIV